MWNSNGMNEHLQGEPALKYLNQCMVALSLYSTATQNYWRRGLALNQHVGIFWRYLTLKFALPLTPNLKFALPSKPTPDVSPWNIGGVGSSGVGHVYFMYISCIFHVVCASFYALATQKLADAKADSSGIWALVTCHVWNNKKTLKKT